MTLAWLIKREVQYLGTAHNVIEMPKSSTWAEIYICYILYTCIYVCVYISLYLSIYLHMHVS